MLRAETAAGRNDSLPDADQTSESQESLDSYWGAPRSLDDARAMYRLAKGARVWDVARDKEPRSMNSRAFVAGHFPAVAGMGYTWQAERSWDRLVYER